MMIENYSFKLVFLLETLLVPFKKQKIKNSQIIFVILSICWTTSAALITLNNNDAFLFLKSFILSVPLLAFSI